MEVKRRCAIGRSDPARADAAELAREYRGAADRDQLLTVRLFRRIARGSWGGRRSSTVRSEPGFHVDTRRGRKAASRRRCGLVILPYSESTDAAAVRRRPKARQRTFGRGAHRGRSATSDPVGATGPGTTSINNRDRGTIESRSRHTSGGARCGGILVRRIRIRPRRRRAVAPFADAFLAVRDAGRGYGEAARARLPAGSGCGIPKG